MFGVRRAFSLGSQVGKIPAASRGLGPYNAVMRHLFGTWGYGALWAAVALGSLGAQDTWDVHDLERPQPPRVVPTGPHIVPPPPSATVLFDGSHLDAWTHSNQAEAQWIIEGDELVVRPGSGQLLSKDVFGDAHVHLEWMVPESEAGDEGQGRGNSGVFLMGLYEVQVLESVGSTTYADGMAGSLYGQYPPAVNAGSGIGRWNSYDLFFRAPRFVENVLIEPASITVLHNGHTIHDGRLLQGITRHKARTQYHLHADRLPLALQDHGDPVRFRNIWVRPLPDLREPASMDRKARLRHHVEFLAHLDPHRAHDQPASLDLAAHYIATQLRYAGLTVRYDEYVCDGTVRRNVVARLPAGEGPVTVVGAHYDSHAGTPGADDNASGVAALIEVARALSSAPPPHPVEFVAYTLEEPPYFGTEDMGSARHARALQQSGEEVRGMVSLEMLGYYSDRPDSQRYPVPGMEKLYPSTANFIAVVTLPEHKPWLDRWVLAMEPAMSLDVQSLAAPAEVTGMDLSDHRNYWARGIPALMITDTSFFRNPHYHEAGDQPETLDYGRMAQVVEGVRAALMAVPADRVVPNEPSEGEKD